jgi:hypothetical protein
MKELRHNGRSKRKEMDQFMRDHAFNGYWFRPHKLRKIRYTTADINLLLQARDAAEEASRKRMVARGMLQYATPQEIAALPAEQLAAFEKLSGRKFINGQLR